MLKEIMEVSDKVVKEELEKDRPKKKLRKHITQKERQEMKEKDIHDRLIVNGILFAVCSLWLIYLLWKLASNIRIFGR